jgi:hypothetical protein
MIDDSFLATQMILVCLLDGQGLDYEARLQGDRGLYRARGYKQNAATANNPIKP